MRRIRLAVSGLSAFALVAGMTATLAASAAQVTAIVDVDVLTADQKTTINTKGAEVVTHIEAAMKQASATGSTAAIEAQREAGKALAILRGIENVSPAARIHDAIQDLMHKSQGKKAKPEDLLPVISVMDEVGEVKGLGVEQARVSLGKAKENLAKGATVEAEADIVEADVSVGYLEIDLPIHATKDRLMRAISALTGAQPDMPNAKAALTDALKHSKTFVAIASGTAVEEDVEN